LLKYAFEHSPDEASRAAEVLIASRKNHWNEPLLSVCGDLTPAQQRRVVVQATDFALAEESASLAERIFDTVKGGYFDDPAAVKTAIEKFPAGDPGSDWGKARQAALDHLGKAP
jgi:hypothetical protein